MNDAWPRRRLGDLFEIGAGKTMSASARLGRPKTPFLRTSNVLWDEIDLSTVDEMAISPEELSVKSLRRGDLLVCEGGEIGRSAIWEEDIAPMAFQNHLHRLRPAVEGVEPRFYVYFLQSAFTQLDLFRGAGNQTTIPNLSRSRLSALEVPLPNREEQRIIAETLRFVRTAVGTQQRLVALAQELRQAALRYLFMRGLHSEPTKDTEIGSIPRSWRVGSLASLCQDTDLVDVRRESDREIEYVDVSSIDRDFNRIRSTSTVVLGSAPSRARKRIRTGDVIFATVRPTLLRVATVPPRLDDQVCSTAFCVLRRAPAVVVHDFIFYLVQRREYIARLAAVERGANYPAVTDRAVKEQLVPIPGLDEQEEIVELLGAIDLKIDLHRRKKVVLEQLFRTLLHDLMTGRIRADDLELPDIGTDTGANTTQDGRE